MRVVRAAADFAAAFEQAQRESQVAFGSSDVFLEKFIPRARHIEVQLLGDLHGNLVHLYERDCSIQRRHQKVVEIAPAPYLDAELRSKLCEAALAIGRELRYENAGTVEFLVDADTGEFYFIEVNPRIQVEHTVTEEVTGIDIVKSQILIAEGLPLSDPEIGLGSQEAVATTGFAIQCRVTTEDPANNFMPDHGRITHYRSASGMGIRLDAGTAFSGAVVTPYYDSLLVKVTARGRRFVDAARRMERSLQEFRVRGVKVNVPFLIQLMTHPQFLAGGCTTTFIDNTPELFRLERRRDRATRLLTFLADTIVNGNPLMKGRPAPKRRAPAPVPPFDSEAADSRTAAGKSSSSSVRKNWPSGCSSRNRCLLTDTTFRDAHQSLLATRFRTRDLLNVAEAYARLCHGLFSIEMWGGATFDSAMRFLKESPWQRLADLRDKIPNILFQMLLARLQRRRLRELSRQRCQGVRPRGGRRGHRSVSHLRFAELGPQHAAWPWRRSKRAERSAKRPSATRATSSTRAAPNTIWRITSRSPKSWRKWGPISWPSRTWPGSANPTRPRSSSKR